MKGSAGSVYWVVFMLVGLTIVILGCAGKEPIKVEKSPTPSLTKNIRALTQPPTQFLL